MGHATVAIISPTLIIRDSTAAVPRKFCVINYSPAAWQRVLRNSEMRCLRARSVSCHLLAPHLFLVSFTPRTNDHERDHSPLLLRDVLRRRSVQKILHRTIIGKPLCPRFSIRIAEPSVRVIDSMIPQIKTRCRGSLPPLESSEKRPVVACSRRLFTISSCSMYRYRPIIKEAVAAILPGNPASCSFIKATSSPNSACPRRRNHLQFE